MELFGAQWRSCLISSSFRHQLRTEAWFCCPFGPNTSGRMFTRPSTSAPPPTSTERSSQRPFNSGLVWFCLYDNIFLKNRSYIYIYIFVIQWCCRLSRRRWTIRGLDGAERPSSAALCPIPSRITWPSPPGFRIIDTTSFSLPAKVF